MDVSSETDQKLVASLVKGAITDYLQQNPALSLRSIASRDDELSREYVRRLSLAEIEDDSINKDKLLRVLFIISRKNTLSEVLKHFEGPIAQFLSDSVLIAKQQKISMVSDTLDQVLANDEQESIVYHLCSNKQGTTVKEVIDILGEKGAVALESLVSKGHVEKKEVNYNAKNRETFFTSIETCKKIAKQFLNFYWPKHFGKKRNYIMTLSGSLNQKGIEAKQDLYRKLHFELSRIYDESQYQGEIPCFDVACMDSFSVIKENTYVH